MSGTAIHVDYRKKLVGNIHEMAASSFANHQVQVLLHQGVHRYWRCRTPGQSAYWFDVVTGPGWIMVSGDIGPMMWRRVRDMIPWCRSAIHSLDYFLEKVPHEFHKTQYDPHIALQWVKERLAEEDINQKHRSELEELIEFGEFDDEHAFSEQLYSSRLVDGCDWPNFKNYNPTFLWCREAILWLLDHIPEEPCPQI